MEKLQELFDLGIEYGYTSKSNKLDGEQTWGFVKNEIDKTKICNWNTPRETLEGIPISNTMEIYSYIHDVLKMYGEAGDMDIYHIDKNVWERYHFVLQTIRIPKTSDCSLLKLVQIAFNIGQYKASNNNIPYEEYINRFIELNKLNKVSSYITSQCNPDSRLIDTTMRILQEQPIWHIKYLKYKTKYIKLKNYYLYNH